MSLHLEAWIRKNWKYLVVILGIFLLVSTPLGDRLLSTMGIQPGPEGVVCSLYGVRANNGLQQQAMLFNLDKNRGVISQVTASDPGSWIAYKEPGNYDSRFGTTDPLYRGYAWVRPDATTPIIQIKSYVGTTYEPGASAINLNMRVSRPTFEDVNVHGDPIGTRSPTQIDWWSYDYNKQESGNTVTWAHKEIYVVPVDFIVELSVKPNGEDGWGAFTSVDLWMVLDTVVWINSFTNNQYILLMNGTTLADATVTAYNYRGAYPIWAWVGGWDPWVFAGRDDNPDKFYDPSDLSSEEMSALQEYVQVMPSFSGSEVTLYHQPDYKYDRVFAQDIIENPDLLKAALNNLQTPDPRFAQTVYTPITLAKFGALKREGGWWLTAWHKLYYPVAYLRVRALYALYGEWTYLWTQEEAEKQDYKWQNQSSIITGRASVWDKFFGGLGSWFGNPFNQLWIFFLLVVIVLIVVSVLNPGLWSMLAMKPRRDAT